MATTIEHWIGGIGDRRARPPGRAAVFNPATGRRSRPRCCWPRPSDVDAAVGRGQGGLRRLGPGLAEQADQGAVRVPRAGQRQHRRARRDHLRRARQGALRRRRRGAARPRGHRVRLRHPAAAQGRVLRPGLDRRRRLLVPPAARRRAPASPRSTSRPWCRCGCTRWPSPAATPSCSSPASATRRRPTSSPSCGAEAGLPDGVFNVVHGDKVAVDALLDHPDVAAVSFVGSTPIARYIHERASANGKRVQALGGAKNHAVDPARRRPRLRRRPPDRRGVRLGRASGAWPSRPRSRSARAGDALMDVAACRKAAGRQGRLRPRPAERDGPGRHPRPRDRIVGLIDTGEQQGAKLVVDGRGLIVPGFEDGLLRRARRCIDQVTTDDGRLHARRSSARCCRSCGPTTSTRRST